MIVAALAAVGVARAGHEITFYPSFYTHEITLKVVDPAAAARGLAKSEVQAYVGGDPFANATAPAHIRYVDSLGAVVTLTFDPAKPAFREASTRCSAGALVRTALAAANAGEGHRSRLADFVAHAYPVTPYHPDWLFHYDLAQDAPATAVPGVVASAERGSAAARPDAMRASERVLRVRAPARFADALTAAGIAVGDPGADAAVEVTGTRAIVDAAHAPWAREGWFQAAQIYATRGDGPDHQAAMSALAQRQHGQYANLAERADLERRIVTGLTQGCARVPLGYLVRREPYSAEYSNGVENVAWDSQQGLRAAIFLRAVKLKDFMWNGWLAVGVPDKPAAAWNPVAGFTDTTGRLVWDAVGDPAALPSPYGQGWLANRTEPRELRVGPVEIPADALVPDRTTGILKPTGAGQTATGRITYRVLFSKFHDGTKMSRADILAPYAFAFRWAGRDSEVERATALMRDRLAAVRVVDVNTEIKNLGDMQLFYEVALVEVYLRGDGAPAEATTIAPPWSAVPWELTALMEEAVARGWAAFSEREARRRGVPWLDLARDGRLKARLATLSQELERRAFVPEALRAVITPNEARERWAALRRFAQENGHYLDTNGPYRLRKVTPDAVVLGVFRDFTYPIGVGAFDRWALPLRAWVTAVDAVPGGLAVGADVERVEKFERSYRILRGPFRPEPAGESAKPAQLVVRYVVLGANGRVKAAGLSERLDGDRVVVALDALQRGEYRVVLAATLGDNLVNPEVKVVPYRVSD